MVTVLTVSYLDAREQVRMDIKGFAVDIDGTLTDESNALNLDSVFALRWLENLGYKVVLVSGRSAWEVYHTALLIGTTGVVVGENGGVVATSPTDLMILGDKYQGLLAYEYLSKAVDDLQLKPTVPRLTEVVLLRTFDLTVGRRLLEESGLPVYLSDSKFAYHLTNKGIDKGVGLRKALKHLGMKPESVIAIGDSETDIPMFEACGYSILVGDHPDEIQAKASASISTKNHDYFRLAIQHVVERFLKVKLKE